MVAASAGPTPNLGKPNRRGQLCPTAILRIRLRLLLATGSNGGPEREMGAASFKDDQGAATCLLDASWSAGGRAADAANEAAA